MEAKEFISSGIIESYVMGLCTPQEQLQVEQMRRQHTEVDEAILSFETALEQQFISQPSATGTKLDATILQTLKELNTPVIDIRTAPVKQFNWFKPAAAAAVLLLIASAVFNYTLFNTNKDLERALSQQESTAGTLPSDDYAILKNPAITPVAMYGVGIHAICRCTMFWDKKSGEAYFMIHHLVPASPDNNYQLWATVNGQPVNVGIINDKIRDRFIRIPNMPKEATGFFVTLEKAGGSTTPTESETYLAGRI